MAPTRQPGTAELIWAARPALVPMALAGSAGWALTAAELAPAVTPWAAAGVAGVWGARRGRERLAAGYREWRVRRGQLDDLYPITIDELRRFPVGEYPVGLTPEGPMVYRPSLGDPPHLLVAGATGSGKTELLNLLIAKAQLDGDAIEVIDAKGGTDYWWVEAGGGEVHHERQAQLDALERALAEIRTRSERLREIEIEVEGPGGAGDRRVGRPLHLGQVPPALLAELPRRLLVIDETASVVAGSDKIAKAAAEALRGIVQLGRSAGVCVVIGMQRPDADYLSGFVKHNVGARIMLGRADEVSGRMVVGAAWAEIAESDAPAERPPGRGVAVDVGAGGARLVQTYLLDRTALLPRLDPAGSGDPPTTSAEPPAGEPELVGVAGDESAGASVVDLRPVGDPSGPADEGPPAPTSGASAVARASAPSSGPRSASPRAGTGTASPCPPSAPPASAPRLGPRLGLGRRRPPAAPSAPRRPAPRGRLGAVGRALVAAYSRWLRPPLARARLRAAAWRLVVGPVRSGEQARDLTLRRSVEARDAGACAACRRDGRAWHADHRRPLWAGGADDLANLQTLCVPCHRAKTAAEATVRAFRRRRRRGLRRVAAPGYVWAALALWAIGVGQALTGAGLGPVPDLRLPLAAIGALAAWRIWATRSRGLDGRATLDARVEGLAPGLYGDTARGLNRSANAWATAKIAALGAALSYYAGVALVVWLA